MKISLETGLITFTAFKDVVIRDILLWLKVGRILIANPKAAHDQEKHNEQYKAINLLVTDHFPGKQPNVLGRWLG